MRPKTTSTAPPIIYGVVLMIVTLVLTVLYNMALVTDWFRSRQAGVGLHALVLVAGWVMGLAVIIGLILFVVSLARQIRLNQRQQNFIDSVTHELKSPLTSLKLHLQTIRRRQLSPEQVAEFTDIMLADVERLDVLIDHVLEAARVDGVRRSHRFEPMAVRPRIEQAIATIARRHDLPPDAIRLEGEDAVVRTDPIGLDLVLSNLLENAVKYSNERVCITVRLSKLSSGGVAIAVADTGVGIPRNQVRRIFHRFHRVGNELTRIRQGTGLGLYIVKETVRQMKGKIRAESPGEGQGSVFTLTLPGDPHG